MGISLEQWRAAIGGFLGASSSRTKCAETDDGPSEPPDDFCYSPVRVRLSWKTAALTLLFLLLTAACQSSLLVMGGVEPHPGPPKKSPSTATQPPDGQQTIRDGHQQVLDKLCATCTSPEIRNTLRLYDVTLSTAGSKTKLLNASVDQLTDAMKFLKAGNQELYLKEKIADNLVVRLHNLFPDKCQICNEWYTVELDETPLMSCEICRQGAHRCCIAGRLGIAEEDIPHTTQDEIKALWNPHAIPGLHYLCGYCSTLGIYLHDPEEGKSTKKLAKASKAGKKAGVVAAAAVEGAGTDAAAAAATATDAAAANAATDASDEADNDDTEEESTNAATVYKSPFATDTSTRPRGHHKSGGLDVPPPPPSHPLPDTCEFYAAGTCRFGMKGNGCDKTHPKPCFKYLKNGTRPVRGCQKGDNCDHFHVQHCQASINNGECLDENCNLLHTSGTRRYNSRPMCKSSLERKECFDQECTLHHVKGTRRHQGRRQQHQTKPASDKIKNKKNHDAQTRSQQEHFLEEIVKSLRSEITSQIDSMRSTMATMASGMNKDAWQHKMHPAQLLPHPAVALQAQTLNSVPPQTQIGTTLQAQVQPSTSLQAQVQSGTALQAQPSAVPQAQGQPSAALQAPAQPSAAPQTQVIQPAQLSAALQMVQALLQTQQ